MYYEIGMQGKLMKKTISILLFCLLITAVFSQTAKKDAYTLWKNGSYAEAIEVCLGEINDKPDNLDSYVVLSWSLIDNGQYKEAEYWSTKGRTVSRYDPRLVEVLAEAQFYLGNNEKSLETFQEYISLATSSSDRFGLAYYFMGEIYVRQAKYNHADIAFSQAVMMKPERDYWWTRLGYAREMAGEYKSAANAYDQALTLNPGRSEAKTGRTRVLQHLQ